MAGIQQLQQLAAKALVNPDFALRLRNDPLPVAAGYGIELTEDQAESIGGVDLRGFLEMGDDIEVDLKPVSWADHW